MLQLLDAPAEANGWAAPIAKETWEAKNTATREGTAATGQGVKASDMKYDAAKANAAFTAGLEAVVAAEPEVTKYDTVVGDGDCGIGLKRGAEGKLREPGVKTDG